MKHFRQQPNRIIKRLAVYGALLLVTALVLLHFHLFRPFDESLKLLLPSILASIITVLIVYTFRHTLFEEADQLLMEPHVDHIATRIVNEVMGRTSSATDLIFFERFGKTCSEKRRRWNLLHPTWIHGLSKRQNCCREFSLEAVLFEQFFLNQKVTLQFAC